MSIDVNISKGLKYTHISKGLKYTHILVLYIYIWQMSQPSIFNKRYLNLIKRSSSEVLMLLKIIYKILTVIVSYLSIV